MAINKIGGQDEEELKPPPPPPPPGITPPTPPPPKTADLVPPPPPPPPVANQILTPPPPPPPPADWPKNAQGVPINPLTMGQPITQVGGPAIPPPLYASSPTMPTYEAPKVAAPVVAGSAAPVTIGTANTVAPTTVNPATHGNAFLSAYTKINGQDQNQIRGQEMDQLQALKLAAEGKGPSAAMSMYKSASDDAIDNQLALAAMAHGTESGVAALQAGKNIGKLQAQAGLGAAQVAAQEQQAARGLLGQQLTSTRDADQKFAIAQSQFDQATNELNAHLQTDVSLRNADFDNETARLKAQLDQATAFRNAAADEQMRAKQGEIDLSNNQFNTGEQNKVGMFNAQQEQNRNNLDAQLKNTFGVSLTELEQKVNQFNATQGQQNTQFYAGLNNQRDLANLNAMLQTMGYNNDQIHAFMAAYMGSAGQIGARDAATRAAQDQQFWDTVNMGANYFYPGAGTAASKIEKGTESRGASGPSSTGSDDTLPLKF